MWRRPSLYLQRQYKTQVKRRLRGRLRVYICNFHFCLGCKAIWKKQHGPRWSFMVLFWQVCCYKSFRFNSTLFNSIIVYKDVEKTNCMTKEIYLYWTRKFTYCGEGSDITHSLHDTTIISQNFIFYNFEYRPVCVLLLKFVRFPPEALWK